MYGDVVKLLEKLAYTPEYYSMGCCGEWIIYNTRGECGFTIHARRGGSCYSF